MSSVDPAATAKIKIRRPPSEVFDAFVDARQMSKFWFRREDDGLKEGKPVTWYIGSGEKAMAFEINVKELIRPDKLVIEWVNGAKPTQVVWTFEETAEGHTILTVVESGFSGNAESIIERVLDSTGGFNQVIVAAKAMIEHGVEVNVVTDHV